MKVRIWAPQGSARYREHSKYCCINEWKISWGIMKNNITIVITTIILKFENNFLLIEKFFVNEKVWSEWKRQAIEQD